MPLLAVGDGTSVSLALMAHDKGSPNIVYQQMLWPAISAELDTESYRCYGEGRFLPRAFMHTAGTTTPRSGAAQEPVRGSAADHHGTAARPAADPHPDRR